MKKLIVIRKKIMLRNRTKEVLLLLLFIYIIPTDSLKCQVHYDLKKMEAIDKMRDQNLQPEKVMDVIGLKEGMRAGEAGASYGYFTLWMSKRVGGTGIVYANDIDASVLELLKRRCESMKITNIKTVKGAIDDPLFPKTGLDMIVVFDCLFEFAQPLKWMQNTKRYLKPDGKLVIVDPDPSKMGESEGFLSRKRIHDFASESGYTMIETDDTFLKTHMIIILQPN